MTWMIAFEIAMMVTRTVPLLTALQIMTGVSKRNVIKITNTIRANRRIREPE
jgi:hypothetical protein